VYFARAGRALRLRLFTDVTIVEGTIADTTLPLKCLFAGDHLFIRQMIDQTIRDVFDDRPTSVTRSRMSIPRLLGAAILRRSRDFDLCAAVLPPMYRVIMDRTCTHRVPRVVRHMIDTCGTWEQVRARFSKRVRGATNAFDVKHALAWRVSHEVADFDLFYERMFVPYIARRHGDHAYIDTRAALRARFDRGMLLLVLRNGQPIAGGLSYREDDALVMYRIGVLDGNHEYVRAHAQTALYLFHLQHAVEHGIARLNVTRTPPFLNDGLFRHKCGWGSRVELDPFHRDEVAHLYVTAEGAKAAHFFDRMPLLVHGGAGLRLLVGAARHGGAGSCPNATLQDRFRHLGVSGVLRQSSRALRLVPY